MSTKLKVGSQALKEMVTKISKEDVKHVAKLSNINITQKEQEKYSKELSEVINYNMSHLKNINTVNIKPTGHAVGEKSVMRDDSTSPGLDVEETLKNTPEQHNNFFKAKHVFGEE